MKTNTMKTIAVAIITAGIVTVGQAAPLVSETFDAYTPTAFLTSPWTSSDNGGSTIRVETGTGTDTTPVMKSVNAGNSGASASVTFAAQTSGILDFSFDVQDIAMGGNGQYFEIGLGNGSYFPVTFMVGRGGGAGATYLVKNGAGSFVGSGTLNYGDWYTWSGKINLTLGTWTLNPGADPVVTGTFTPGATIDRFTTLAWNTTDIGSAAVDNISLAIEVVPEPSTVLLFALGGGVVLAYRRRQRAM